LCKAHPTNEFTASAGLDLHPVRAYSKVGGRAPAHCVATGKAPLAHVPYEQGVASLKVLHRFTPRTITSYSDVLEELEKTRARGYAANRGEWRETVFSMAAPIFDAQGHCCAALGISGPSDWLGNSAMKRFAPIVVRAAAGASRAMGFAGGSIAIKGKSGTRRDRL
jgi:IclR family transcriptional regulator, KDG regulon repressor